MHFSGPDTQKNRCKSTEQPFRETLAKRLHALLCAYPPFNPKDKSPPGKKSYKTKKPQLVKYQLNY